MSKNTNLSFLTDFLTADIVNSRVGMNNVSPQSTFDVTGTGKFSGVLTLGSTVSNGTYTYTLPSATGTLALVGGSGVGTVTSVAAITLGTSGTDLTSTVANGTTTPVITLNVPDASVTARGVITTGTQYIAGLKIFTSTIVANVDLQLPAAGTASTTFIKNINGTGLASFGSNGFGFNNADNIYFSGSNKGGGVFAFSNTGTQIYTLQNASGTLAFTSQIPTNAVGGTGTLNTIPKFTAATTIGNSNIFDSGSIIYNTNPAAGTFAWQFNGSTVTGQSYGAQVIAGTNASDIGFKVMNAAASINYLIVRGDGLVTLTGALNGTSAVFSSTLTSVGATINGANNAIIDLYNTALADTNARNWRIVTNDSAWGSIEFKVSTLYNNAPSSTKLTLASTGAATFSAATAAITLTANGAANQWTTKILASSTTSQSYGLTVQAGTNASDIAFQVIPVSGSGSLLQILGNGNLGLGVTPSAWGSPFVVSQYPYGSYFGGTTTGGTVMGNNNYYNGSSYIYQNSDFATQYQQASGTHFWRTAPSGTAGNAITFTQAMTLTSGGNLLVGTTTDAGYKLDVNGTGRFSGNVIIDGTSNGYLTLNATSTGGNESGIFFQVGGGNKWENYTANNDTALNWYSYANSTIVFKLASTGAATFSSSVTATSGTFYVGDSINGTYFLGGSGNTARQLKFSTSTTTNIGDTHTIDAQSSSGVLNFAITSAPKMTIANNGNVGIGTASPATLLHLSSASAAYQLRLESTTGTNAAYLGFKNTGGQYYIGADNSAGSGLFVTGGSAYAFSIVAEGSRDIILGNNNTERMRIDSSGQTFTISTGTAFSAGVTASAGTSTAIYVGRYGGTAGNFNSGTVSYVVWSNGNVVNTNNSYGSYSDIKLKENIEDATPKLDDLMKVKVRNYNLIGDDKKQIGVIAQELEEVFPAMIDESEDFEEVEVPQVDEEGNEVLNEEGEVVTENKRVSKGTTTKSVKYSVFVPMLIKAIQELKTEIDKLKNS